MTAKELAQLHTEIWKRAAELGATRFDMFELGCVIIAYNYANQSHLNAPEKEMLDFYLKWYKKISNDLLLHLKPENTRDLK